MATKKQSAWTGWIYFAAIIMMVNGAIGILAGLSGIFGGGSVAFIGPADTWLVDLSTWGWLHLVVSGLVLWAAFSLVNGGTYGRLYAIVASVIGIIANVAYTPVFPFWGLLGVALYVMVLYAVVVHGDELKA